MAVRPYVAVVLGAFCVAMSLELFYIPYRLVDGGMAGLAVVIGRVTNMQPVYPLLLLDFACIGAGVRTFGEPFLYRSATALLTLGALLRLVGPLDPLLPRAVAAVIGGAGVGLGVSLLVRAGAAADGCEVLALLVQTWSGFPVPWFSFLFNTFVFVIVAYAVGLANAYHSILAQGSGLIVMALLLRGSHPYGSWH